MGDSITSYGDDGRLQSTKAARPHPLQHLDKTPNQYIQWRYAIGEDREALTKVDRKLTEEEEKKMKTVHVIDGVKRVVEKILGRRRVRVPLVVVYDGDTATS